MKSKDLPVIIYVAAAGGSMILSVGEGYIGIGSMLIFFLTLPWSLSMIFFAWVFIHDGARSLLIFLIPFAVLNAYIIYRLANSQRKNEASGGDDAA